MNLSLKIFLMLGILVYLAFLLFFIRKKGLNLVYTMLWFLFGIVMIVCLVFPGVLEWVADLMGIITPVNAMFLIVLFLMLLILLNLSTIVSKHMAMIKTLTQTVALLENQIASMNKNTQAQRKPVQNANAGNSACGDEQNGVL